MVHGSRLIPKNNIATFLDASQRNFGFNGSQLSSRSLSFLWCQLLQKSQNFIGIVLLAFLELSHCLSTVRPRLEAATSPRLCGRSLVLPGASAHFGATKAC